MNARGESPRRPRSLRARLARSQLRALGHDDLPPRVRIGIEDYALEETLQHSFFAATGAYRGPAGHVVVKFGRQAPFLGLPLRRLGQWLARREIWFYGRVQDLPAVPRCLGAVGEGGLAHDYVEGRPHRRPQILPDAFFADLRDQIAEMHRREIAYVDLSKPENILIGDDGRPHLIDLQTAFHWPARAEDRVGWQRRLPHRWGRWLLRQLQEADRVHVLKHWRRSSPLGLTTDQYDESIRRTGSIRLHTRVRKPYRAVRRFLRELLAPPRDRS